MPTSNERAAYRKHLVRNVTRGVAWLDNTAPGWRDLIDVDTVDLVDYDACVLGQVFRAEGCAEGTTGYDYAVTHLFDDLASWRQTANEHGFSLSTVAARRYRHTDDTGHASEGAWSLLTDVWRRELAR